MAPQNPEHECVDILLKFFKAMNEWESFVAANNPSLDSPNRDSFREEVCKLLDGIGQRFCTSQERVLARRRVIEHGNPPEYDDKRVQVTDVELVANNKAHVYINDPQPHYSGRARYTLKTVNGKWCVDSRDLIDVDGSMEAWDL